MVALPEGTVTFLFTDIEGSTRLLQQLGDRYADVLFEHRDKLRAVRSPRRRRVRNRGRLSTDDPADRDEAIELQLGEQ